MQAIEKFMPLILQIEEEEQAPTPIISTQDGVHFLYIRHNNLFCTVIAYGSGSNYQEEL